MKLFLGIMFLTGLVKKPEMELYWSTDEFLSTPIFGKVMSRNRYENIWSFLHFNDNEARPNNDTDPLYKVRPVLDMLLGKFRDLYNPASTFRLMKGCCCGVGGCHFACIIPQSRSNMVSNPMCWPILKQPIVGI